MVLATLTPPPEPARHAAFTALYRRHWRAVVDACLGVADCPADAEDAAQDAFVALHGALDRVRGEAALAAWLRRTAVRIALGAHRGWRIPPPDPDQDAPAANPAIRREQADRMRAAVRRLPAEHQAVLGLHAVCDLSPREIGAFLAMPESTVWARLLYARAKVARHLGGVR
jgi:RNA polymerase sigma-70 factor (ECF subfamily)